MTTLLALAELENSEEELVPEILPVDARLSVKGQVSVLVDLFERAVAVAPVKEVIQGTSFVLIESFQATTTHVSYVQVTATDGEHSIAVLDDSLTINMAGAALVPGKRLLEILKLCPEESVRIDIFGNTATIRSGRAVWTVQTPVGDSLPPFPSVEGISLYPVQKQAFLKALETARKAVATTTARTSLMQASVASGVITACDSARVHRQAVDGLPESVSLTLPVRVMDEAIRSLRAYEDEVFEMGSNHQVVVFHFGRDILIGSRLVVEFPDIEPLLLAPAMMNTQKLTVDRKELLESIKRVRVNADPEYFAIFLALNPTKLDKEVFWNLSVRARDRAGNTSQESFSVKYEGGTKAREICLNHKYLTDLLSCTNSDKVTFLLGEDSKTKPAPLLISDKDSGFTGIVSPMSISVIK